METADQKLHDAENAPHTTSMVEELGTAISAAGPCVQRRCREEDALNCWWPGQSADGKKHQGKNEKPPFPWDGASDTRIRLVKERVRLRTAMLNQAFARSRWKFVGVDGLDFVKAAKRTQFMRWQVFKQMGRAAARQRKLATYWLNSHGLSIMSVTWSKIERLGLETVTIQTLTEIMGIAEFWPIYQQNKAALSDALFAAQLANVGLTPEMENTRRAQELETMLAGDEDLGIANLAALLRETYPDCNQVAAERAAKELRETGESDVPKKRVVYNAPEWNAYLPFYNIFFPVETTEISRARWIAIRKWYSKTEVQRNSDWPEDFKKTLLEHPGASQTESIDTFRAKSTQWKGKNASEFVPVYDHKDEYEVFEFYYPAVNAEGVEQLQRTVLSILPKIENSTADDRYIVAEHGIWDDNGFFPFIALEANSESDFLLDNEGIASLLHTHQWETKKQRDARIDAADINILPPIVRNIRDERRPLTIGPDSPIYESTPETTRWLNPPNSKTWMSEEIEKSVLRDADRLAGIPNNEAPAQVTQLVQEDLITNYLDAMAELLSKTFALDQLYMDDATVLRVNGMFTEPFKVSRDEIQGSYDIYMTFDPREMDTEFAQSKVKALAEIKRLDPNGVIDSNLAVELSLSVLDPDWAEALITGENQAAQRELTEEKNNVAMIMTGQEPIMKEQENAQLRLGYLNQITQTSPTIAQALATNPMVQKLFENRVKHLQFILQQQQNAEIGRVGVKPVLA